MCREQHGHAARACMSVPTGHAGSCPQDVSSMLYSLGRLQYRPPDLVHAAALSAAHMLPAMTALQVRPSITQMHTCSHSSTACICGHSTAPCTMVCCCDKPWGIALNVRALIQLQSWGARGMGYARR